MNKYITLLTLINIEDKELSKDLPEVTQLEIESSAKSAKEVPLVSDDVIKQKLQDMFKREITNFFVAKRAVYRKDLFSKI